jgi:hypothetical protein
MNRPFNNIATLAAWKNLQANGGYITKLIITLHHNILKNCTNNTHNTPRREGNAAQINSEQEILK